MGCVRKRGGSWSAQVRVSRWRSFNRTFQTKSDALKWINNLELKLRSSDVPDTVNSQKTTFAKLLEGYASEVSPSHKGADAEIYRLKSIARSWLGRIDVRYLNKHQFNQYRDDRLKNVSGGSVCAELALMKRVLETAKRRWGVGIPYNPILEVEFPRGFNPRNRRLRNGELECLLTAASSQRNIYIAPIIEFAIETGMRRSEILNLRWVDVDLDSGFASLFDTKNGEDRRVPLTKAARDVLLRLPKQDERVFPISANCVRLAWERCRKKAGISDLRFHDLRHEAVSRFFEMGMSVPEVALISGHKDVRQLFRYTHLNPINLFKKYKAF